MKQITDGVIKVIVDQLNASKTPMTCYDLLATDEVAALAPTAALVSNYLGYMWRKGLLQRHLTQKAVDKTRVRYAYELNPNSTRVKVLLNENPSEPVGVSRHLGGRVEVNEANSSVTLHLPEAIFTIQFKK